MDVKIFYSQAQLHTVADFLWKNSPHVLKWSSLPKNVIDVKDAIYDNLKKVALENANIIVEERRTNKEDENNWISYSGTGGYYFIFDLISDGKDSTPIMVSVDILVDLTINQDVKGFITEVIDSVEINN